MLIITKRYIEMQAELRISKDRKTTGKHARIISLMTTRSKVPEPYFALFTRWMNSQDM
jgi:hypothetical protein